MTEVLDSRVRITHWLCRALLLVLIGAIALWTMMVTQTLLGGIVITLIKVFPLLCFIPAVFRGHPRTHAWLCFVLLVYFCFSVIYILSPNQQTMALLQSGLTLMLFTCAMLFARWKTQQQRLQRQDAQGPVVQGQEETGQA